VIAEVALDAVVIQQRVIDVEQKNYIIHADRNAWIRGYGR
jgi:hypothetical protein